MKTTPERALLYTVHNYRIPADNRFRVKDGTPLCCKNRNICFPTVWEVNAHPLTHSVYVNKIWVMLIDTSDEGHRAMSKFESILTDPDGILTNAMNIDQVHTHI